MKKISDQGKTEAGIPVGKLWWGMMTKQMAVETDLKDI